MALNTPFHDAPLSEARIGSALPKRSTPAVLWSAPALVLLAVACASREPAAGPPRATPEQIPASIAAPGSTFTFGFAVGRLSTTVTVAPFAISKTPITVGQYKECVAGGACAVPSLATPACTGARVPVVQGPTYDASASADGLPVTCTTSREAANYCSWVGGALPTIEQWVYAARGPTIQQFAWGTTAPTCSQNQRAVPTYAASMGCCPSNTCDPSTYYAVGQHPDVASPMGLLDVLLTPAELLKGSKGSLVPACSSELGACIVDGMLPGAIDFAAHISDRVSGSPDQDPGMVAGFRCAFEVKS